MELSYVSDVDNLISGLEATYVSDRTLSTSEAPGWTDTCFTCHCVTQ